MEMEIESELVSLVRPTGQRRVTVEQQLPPLQAQRRPTSSRPAWEIAHVEPRQAPTPRYTTRPPGRKELLRFSPRSPFHLRGAT